MPFRAVYCDLDGTLLDPERRITPRSLAALAALKRGGIRVGIASGRTRRSALPYLDHSGADAPAILFQGARVYEPGGALLSETPLATSAALALLALARRHGVFVNCYLGDEVWAAVRSATSAASAEKDGVAQRLTPDLAAVARSAPVTKLMMIAAVGDLDAFERVVRAEIVAKNLSVRVVRSEPHYLEAVAPGVSKGTALASAAAHIGVALADIVAFGDQLNDLEMLAAAGLGIAMGNAHPEIKAVAGHVCASHANDGVALALAEIFGV